LPVHLGPICRSKSGVKPTPPPVRRGRRPGEGGDRGADRQRSCIVAAPHSSPSLPAVNLPFPVGVPVLGVALAPDFDAFFGGLEVAVITGFVVLIALVVVAAIRKIFSI
jgi:hypothetical protein